MARLVPVEEPAKRLVPVQAQTQAAPTPAPAPEDVRDPRTGVPGGAAQPVAAPVERSLADNLLIGVQNVGRGLADVAGFPADLGAMGLNAVMAGTEFATGIDTPRFDRPFLGSDWIADAAGGAAEMLGADLFDEEDLAWNERIVRDATRFGTGALAAGAGLTGAAARASRTPGAPSAVDAAVSTPLARTLSDPYTHNAARTVTGDVAGGVGAGIGVGTYEEMLPEEQQGPVGALLSALAGGVGGVGVKSVAEGLGSAALNTGRNMVGRGFDTAIQPDPLTGARTTLSEADRAAMIAQQAASNPAVAARNISDAFSEFDQIAPRGAQPTVGAASDDVGLAILEGANRTRNPEPFITRDMAVNTQARSLADSSAPAGATGRALTDFIDDRVDNAFKGVGLLDYYGRGPEASKRIDSVFRDELEQARKTKEALYQDPEMLMASVSPAPLYKTATQIEDSLGIVGDPDSIPSDVIGRIKGLANFDEETGELTGFKDFSYSDVQDLRAQVGSRLREAVKASGRGDSGSGPLVRNLIKLRDELSAYADTLAEGDGAVAQKASDAIGFFRNEYAPRFREGQAGRFAQDIKADRYGTRTRPEDTASRFLGGGKRADVDSLDKAIRMSEVPERAEDARAYLLSNLASSGATNPRTGAIKPDAARRWYDRNREVVDAVPGMREELTGILQKNARGVEVEQRIGRLARKEPSRAVETAFKSDDPARAVKDLVAEIGENSEARAGLKAAVRDYMIDRATTTAVQKTTSGDRPLSFAKLENFFNDNAEALAEVYSPEEMNALRASHKLLRPLNNLMSRATTGSDTNEKAQRLWRALEAGLKGVYGVLKGGGILRTIRVASEALPNDRANVERLIERMMFDPDLAVHLLSKDVADKVATPEWNTKLANLIRAGAAARENTDDE